MPDREYISPDGQLRFVIRACEGRLMLGFDGTPWHTHDDLLAAAAHKDPEAAVEEFLWRLLSDQLVVAVSRIGGKLHDVWVTEDPERDRRYCGQDEFLEFRVWSGKSVQI